MTIPPNTWSDLEQWECVSHLAQMDCDIVNFSNFNGRLRTAWTQLGNLDVCGSGREFTQ